MIGFHYAIHIQNYYTRATGPLYQYLSPITGHERKRNWCMVAAPFELVQTSDTFIQRAIYVNTTGKAIIIWSTKKLEGGEKLQVKWLLHLFCESKDSKKSCYIYTFTRICTYGLYSLKMGMRWIFIAVWHLRKSLYNIHLLKTSLKSEFLIACFRIPPWGAVMEQNLPWKMDLP